MTCSRVSRVSCASGGSAISAAPMLPWIAPARISPRVSPSRRRGVLNSARAMKKNITLASSFPKRRISSGVIGVTAAPAAKAMLATSTKASTARPGASSGTRQLEKTILARTAPKVAINTVSTKVSWAPASGTGMTPNGKVATTATKSHRPTTGRQMMTPRIRRPNRPAAGTSGVVAAARRPTSTAAPAASSSTPAADSVTFASIGVAGRCARGRRRCSATSPARRTLGWFRDDAPPSPGQRQCAEPPRSRPSGRALPPR